MRTMIYLFLFFQSITISYGQEKISSHQLKTDFDKLIDILEETHPSPYYPFGGRMLFHKEALRVKKNILEDGMTKNEFYFLLSAFISKLHDGHTFIDIPKKLEQKYSTKILPIQFSIVSDGMIVIRTMPEWSDLIGHKLLRINNWDIGPLLNLIQQYEPCENLSGAYYLLNKYISRQSWAQQIFHDINGSLEFTFASIDTKKKELIIPYVSNSRSTTWNSSRPWIRIQADKPVLFRFQFIDDENKIGYFPFHTVYAREVIEIIRNNSGNYQSTIEMLYRNLNLGEIPEDIEIAIKNIPSLNETFFGLLSEMKRNESTHLIIDLRQNAGGWTPITLPTLFMLFGDAFFEYECEAEYNTRISGLYLQKQNMTIEQYNMNRNTSLNVGDYHFGYFIGSKWPSHMSLEERREKYFQQNIGFTSGLELLKSQNGQPVYTPTLIVITSPATFSAAFHYLYFLKELGNAIIVGVSPRQAYNTGMETTNFTLPNSQLSGSVSNSYQMFMPNDLEKGKQLIPDYEISWEIYSKYEYDPDTVIRYIIDMIEHMK